MGHTLTDAGLKTDEEKVQAITEFPAPHDSHHPRRFIGMVKYLSKVDNLLTTKCEPLNRLTQKNQVFQWAEVQQRAFEDIKKAITNTPVLNLWRLKKSSHDTDWHVSCRSGNCPSCRIWNQCHTRQGFGTTMKKKKKTRTNWKKRWELLCLDYTSSVTIAKEVM